MKNYNNTGIIKVMKESIKIERNDLFDYSLNLLLQNNPTEKQLHIAGKLSIKVYGEFDPRINTLLFG